MAIAVRLKHTSPLPDKTIKTHPRFHPGCRPDLLHRVHRRKSKPVCEIGCQGGPWRSSSMASMSLSRPYSSYIPRVYGYSTPTCIPLFDNNFVSNAETLVRLSPMARYSAREDCLLECTRHIAGMRGMLSSCRDKRAPEKLPLASSTLRHVHSLSSPSSSASNNHADIIYGELR